MLRQAETYKQLMLPLTSNCVSRLNSFLAATNVIHKTCKERMAGLHRKLKLLQVKRQNTENTNFWFRWLQMRWNNNMATIQRIKNKQNNIQGELYGLPSHNKNPNQSSRTSTKYKKFNKTTEFDVIECVLGSLVFQSELCMWNSICFQMSR